jgi:hypothetical protein
MRREHDRRTGRPVINGRDVVEELTMEELEVELTIAVGAAKRRANRLNLLLRELDRRRARQLQLS